VGAKKTVTSVEAEEPNNQPTSNQKSSWFKNHRWWLLSVVALIIVGGGLLAIHLSKTSLGALSVAGIPAGRNIPDPSLGSELKTAASAYKITVQYPDGNVQRFALAEAGLEADIDATLARAWSTQKDAHFFSRLAFWKTNEIPLAIKIDEAALQNFINAKATQAYQPVQNANITVSEGNVSITTEASGRGYTIKNPKRTIENSAAKLSKEPLVLRKAELQPTIFAKNLERPKQQLESILAQSVKFNIGYQEIVASRSDIGNWIDIKPNETEGTVEISINADKLFGYINKATYYYQNYRSVIIVTLPDGSKLNLKPGVDGLEPDNKDKLAAALAPKISEASGLSVPIAIEYTNTRTPNYSYDKWIAVDLTAKRLYAYEKTNLVKTYLVSAGAPATPTTPGFHKIYSKVRIQDMRGPNADGSSYFQPNVEWVNYFYGGEAIHGNYWRPTSYFGRINSSHGCVGLLNADAMWVYNWAPVGTPVVTYN